MIERCMRDTFGRVRAAWSPTTVSVEVVFFEIRNPKPESRNRRILKYTSRNLTLGRFLEVEEPSSLLVRLGGAAGLAIAAELLY